MTVLVTSGILIVVCEDCVTVVAGSTDVMHRVVAGNEFVLVKVRVIHLSGIEDVTVAVYTAVDPGRFLIEVLVFHVVRVRVDVRVLVTAGKELVRVRVIVIYLLGPSTMTSRVLVVCLVTVLVVDLTMVDVGR